ncbi:uncharacterized protein DUF4233 [Micromonospora pisi]|uniref:Uncharacterized protein DUF4233 n=1 Tax=Micromonospora pisi TaxID=589240 RepID=A0A495JG69_9ACTN|nr:DUF4233 domain-containing protein [Micromonospora pisi]RKR87771.1 uncharacterized protein DUF4233 [Micromonospora pisi]
MTPERESTAAESDRPAAESGGRPSGLRNPVRAVRGLGAGTLVIEMLVLLLAIQPIRLVGGDLSGTAIGCIAGLAVLALLLSGLLSRGWAWHAATGLQGLLLLASFLHWSLGVLGVIFALVWGYVLHVRRTILG